jgi:hypothetical protein
VWQLRRAQNLTVDPVLLHTGFVHGDEKFAKLQELGALNPNPNPNPNPKPRTGTDVESTA